MLLIVSGLVGEGLVGGVLLLIVSGLVDVVLLPVKACFNITSCLNAAGETEMQLKDTMLVGSQLNEKLPPRLGTLIHGSIEALLDGDEQSPQIELAKRKYWLILTSCNRWIY